MEREKRLVVWSAEPVPHQNWLGFERLTVVPSEYMSVSPFFPLTLRARTLPVDTRLVDRALLSKDERQWLQCHNQWCKDKLKPLLHDDKRALQWLKRQ